MMRFDFNILQRRASELVALGRYSDALRIYIFMVDGDNSLDGGHFGVKIAECYEAMGELQVAKYWYGRAEEENPGVLAAALEGKRRLASVNIDDLIRPEEYETIPDLQPYSLSPKDFK